MIRGNASYSSISVVVPVYNGAQSLPELVRRLQQTLAGLVEQYEVILVNDDSRDDSWAVVCRLVEEYSLVRGLDLMRNYGQHNALLAGIRAAEHELIVTIDDDLQQPPEEIPLLLERLAEGYDVVYGTPRQEQHGLWRDLASRITKLALQASMGVAVARNVSAFRVFRTHLRDAFEHYEGAYVSIDVLLTWGTTRFAAVPVRHEPRQYGTSNYTFRKLMLHALNMITGYSAVPLQVASLVGIAFSFFGLAVLLYVLIRYFVLGGSVAGFPFLASIIAIFSGAQLFALGIFGEYLARMHFRTMGRPSAVVREETRRTQPKPNAGDMS